MEGSSFININLTFVLEVISFVSFFYVIYSKYWPNWLMYLDQRAKKIAQGLENAESASKNLAAIENERKRILHQASMQTEEIIQKAESATKKIFEEATLKIEKTQEKKQREFAYNLEKSVQQARSDLQAEVGNLAIKIAEKILEDQRWDAQCLQNADLTNLLKEIQIKAH